MNQNIVDEGTEPDWGYMTIHVSSLYPGYITNLADHNIPIFPSSYLPIFLWVHSTPTSSLNLLPRLSGEITVNE